jgi:hypothetical protein
MVKKIVRLTESDLVRLVKRVVKEQSEIDILKMNTGADIDKAIDDYYEKQGGRPAAKPLSKSKEGPFAHHKDIGWYDSKDRASAEPTDYSEEREFGPGEYDDFMEFINNCDNKWCLQTKRFYDTYANQGKIKVRK